MFFTDRIFERRPAVTDVGYFHLLRAVDMAVSTQAEGRFGTPVTDYTGENVSTKVATAISDSLVLGLLPPAT